MKKFAHTYNRTISIEIIIIILLFMIPASVVSGNQGDAADTEKPAVTRKGWLAAPFFSQEWEIQGTKGDRLIIRTSPISDGVVPEIFLLFDDKDQTPAASAARYENGCTVLDYTFEKSDSYVILIRNRNHDAGGGYTLSLSLKRIAAPVSALQANADAPVDKQDSDDAGLAWWEVGTMASVGTALTVLTGQLAPLAIMVTARIAALLPL